MFSGQLFNQQEQHFLNHSKRQKMTNQMAKAGVILIIIAILVTGIIVSSIFALEANKERIKAEQTAEELACQVIETDAQRVIAETELNERVIAEEKAKIARVNKLIAEGSTSLQKERFDEAILSYRRANNEALLIDPNPRFFDKNEMLSRIRHLRQTADNAKNDHNFNLNLNTGLALIQVNDYKAAQQYLAKAYQSRSDDKTLNNAIELCREKADLP